MVRIDTKAGTLMGSLSVKETNGEWQELTCELRSPLTGVHDVFFTFKANDASMLEFDSWQFYTASSDIDIPQAGNVRPASGVYDLNGRRMNGVGAPKAVRIINGKKVMK